MVKHATETTAQVELHSKCQTIMVDRSRIAIVGGPARGCMHSFPYHSKGIPSPEVAGQKWANFGNVVCERPLRSPCEIRYTTIIMYLNHAYST